jgi:hypothetical protein
MKIYRMTDFSFAGSFNMGYEGFSKPLALPKMHPVYGNKAEFLVLLGLFCLVPLVVNTRKYNEDKMRQEVRTNNRYAALELPTNKRQPLKWDLK